MRLLELLPLKKPKYLYLENVPGLLNHDSGKTFETILRTGSPKSCTLTCGSGGFGGHSGLYLIEDTENFGLPIKSKTKDGYQIAYPGDSIDTAFSGQN